jgi:hypothetical protein
MWTEVRMLDNDADRIFGSKGKVWLVRAARS